jgi:Glycosyltransferase family 87
LRKKGLITHQDSVIAPFAYRSSRAVNRALKTYLLVLGSLWGIALLFVGVRGLILHQGYPFNTFLLVPSYRFSDFTVYDQRFAVWGHGDQFFSLPGFKFDYPAPMLIGQLAFYKLSSAPLYCYLATVVLFALAGGILSAAVIPKDSRVRMLAAAAAVCTALFSYPLFFLLDRANTEGLVWIASSLGLVFFAIRRYGWAAGFLGLAASMKIFPAVLILLLLAKKRYRDFSLAIAATVAFSYGSLWLAGPTTNRAAEGIADGLAYLRQIQIFDYKPIEINFDHSLFAVVKQMCFRAMHDVGRVNGTLPHIYLIYGVFAAGLFSLTYLFAIRRLAILNQLLILSAFSVVLPYVSYDYTLVNLFVPFATMIFVLSTDAADGRLRLTNGQLLCLLLPYAVIFTPQSYLVYHVVGYAAQVKTVALFAAIVTAIRVPLPSSLFNELYPVQTLLLNLDLEPALQPLEREYV